MKKHLIAAAVAGLAAFSSSAVSAQEYPARPIQMVVPWGAGGGTDAVARIIASVMQEELGTSINVVNRTGGSGVVGHSAIATAPADGYTIGLATVEIVMLHWQGLTDMTYKDFDILGLVNYDPAGVTVRAGSDYKTIQELQEAIASKPKGTFKGSGTAQGGIWHVALAGWMMDADIDPGQVSWVPSQGAATALTDLVAGGVDLVTNSLAESDAMISAGRVTPLVTFGKERNPSYPDVPTLKETTGSDWETGAWRGVFAPKGLPDDVKAKLMAAVEKAYNSDQYQEFMKSRGLGVMWAPADEAVKFVADSDESMGRVMKAAGLATK